MYVYDTYLVNITPSPHKLKNVLRLRKNEEIRFTLKGGHGLEGRCCHGTEAINYSATVVTHCWNS